VWAWGQGGSAEGERWRRPRTWAVAEDEEEEDASADMGESRAEAEPAEDSMFAEAVAVLDEDCGRMAVGAVGAVGGRWGDSGAERTVLGEIEGGCGVDGSSEASMGREREAADWSRSASPRQRPRLECGQLNGKLRQG
jgi:hypothetical protein